MQAQTNGAPAPARRGSQRKIQPVQQFQGKVIRFDSRPRIVIGDVVELCGGILAGNAGKICIVTGFDKEGWVTIQSISGALDSRDLETNVITRELSIYGRTKPENCYRLSRELAKGYRHV